MWHIVAIGYLFVAVMFSAAQPSIARALIYLVFWAVLPTVFMVFVVTIRLYRLLAGRFKLRLLLPFHQAVAAADEKQDGKV